MLEMCSFAGFVVFLMLGGLFLAALATTVFSFVVLYPIYFFFFRKDKKL
jgi:hypothetical protein